MIDALPQKTPKKEYSATNEELLKGLVERVTFHSKESGFGVIKIKSVANKQQSLFNTGDVITVVGVFPESLGPGLSIVARGSWQEHEKFGRQFRARSITEVQPTESHAVIRYLSSGIIKGLGPVLAERIVNHFGDETLAVLEKDPQALKNVPGIGEKKCKEIIEAWEENRNAREVLLFFQGLSLPMSLGQRVYRAFGKQAIEKVTGNPYILSTDVWGIGFLTADRIARSLGIDEHAEERIIAGLSYALKSASDDGHCFLPEPQLVAKTSNLLRIESHQALITSCIHKAKLRAEIIQEEERIYLSTIYNAESTLALTLRKQIAHKSTLASINPDLVKELCSVKQESTGLNAASTPQIITFSDEQCLAIQYAAEQSILAITGGPGCGKTTVLRAIAKLFRKAGLRLKLAAPTGRAAQRLAEVCGMEASTIHRLLKFDPDKRDFVHCEEDPLPLDALVVDESSMIDVSLAASLMRAVPKGARVVFVGDADQLPSVGPGLFLADLLRIEAIPQVRLTQLFRRAHESQITHIAHDINTAKMPFIPEPGQGYHGDAYFLPAPDKPDALALVNRLVCDQIPKKFGLSGSDITVLSPMNQGELGVKALNLTLQQKLVPRLDGTPWVKVNDIEFRLGDRVIQRVNNYKLHANGVFNGDQGEVIGIDNQEKSLYVRLWDGREVTYKSEHLGQLDLAYAMTIHRSQGSEVPAVVMVIHDTHYVMLERQLIYTGITRAKKLLIVVGTKKALSVAVRKNKSSERFSYLKEKTEELLQSLF